MKGQVLLFIQGYSFALKALVLSCLMVCLIACTANPLGIEAINQARMARTEIQTDTFRLMSFTRAEKAGAPLVVYIEGDGHSWVNRNTPSTDPTPHKAVALELALQDSAPNLAYLARPCQYVKDDPACNEHSVWTSHRFAPKVIGAINEAIDALLKNTKTTGVHLAGYSGGAAVAVLIAAQRKDVLTLRTIAGNLDTEELNRFHEVSPMPESLNPIDAAPILSNIPQQHWIGLKDETIPPFIAERFVKALGSPTDASIITVKDASHQHGWSEEWKKFSEFIY